MDFQLSVELRFMPAAVTTSMFHFKAWALKSVPSLNLTPFLKCSVIDGFAGSVLKSVEVAKQGVKVPPNCSLVIGCKEYWFPPPPLSAG